MLNPLRDKANERLQNYLHKRAWLRLNFVRRLLKDSAPHLFYEYLHLQISRRGLAAR
jgi:hypothetical protein